MKQPLITLLATLLTLPGGVVALDTDELQPTYIEADRVEIDDAKGISIYRGNVVLTKGSIRLLSDLLTVYNAEGETERYVADGEPATYQQTMEKSRKELLAKGNKIEYQLARQIITLTDNAHVLQDGDEFHGDRIVYNMRSNQVQASAEPTSKERVRMVIQPRARTTP